MNASIVAADKLTRAPAGEDALHGYGMLTSSMLTAVLDQSLDCIKVLGPDGRLDFMNGNGLCAMEIESFDLVAGKDWWSLWPAEAQPQMRDAVIRASAGERVRLEAYCPTYKGSPRWWEVSVFPLHDRRGELQGLLSVSRDITDRVTEREMRETFAAEMRHRLQNAYALAGSLVNSAARGDPEREAFAREVLERLAQLGAAQRLLLESGTAESAPLNELLSRLLDPFASGQCKLDIADIPEVELPEDQVRTLALVIGELSTNSNKYGAMGFGGTIRVRATRGSGELRLCWIERPISHTAPPSQGDGSGHRLVTRALAALGGAMTIDWRDDGLDVTVTLPSRA